MEARDIQQTTGFEKVANLLATLSLFGSGAAAYLVIPSIRPGFYGGTALLIFFLVIGQFAMLVVGVGLPTVIQAFRHRLRISRKTRLLLIAASCGVLLEAAALYFIPVIGSS